ncbi:site-specific DNA-methyltransferase [Polaribacter sp.]|nr:site-specific DNA-methyltransferase [Polaribacter sp.]
MPIKKINLGDPLSQSADLVHNNIDKLKMLFPEIVTEGKIDFKVLQQVLGEELEEAEEYYRFTWAGKSQARREAHKPSTGTLRPAKEESLDWDTTENMYIEGDNLEVLKLMQKSYAGKIKMIYIDPPYNTGKDFVYKDNYKDNLKNYQEVTGQVDSDGNKISTNSDSDGRYHSNWLNMMYPRLRLARNLLKDDGVIFMSIDDNEVENLKKLGNEIFGSENHIGEFIRQSKIGGGSDSKFIVKEHEYCICFSKNVNALEDFFTEHDKEYLKRYKEEDSKGKYFWDTLARGGLKNPIRFEVEAPDGTKLTNNWNRSKTTFYKDIEDGEIQFKKKKDGNWNVYFKQRLNLNGKKPRSFTSDLGNTIDGKNSIKTLFQNDKIFSYPKPPKLISFLSNIIESKNEIILDFFSGSSTTAHAVLELNKKDFGKRNFIQVQLPETTDETSEARKLGYDTITEIGKERIRRVVKKIKEEHPEKSKGMDLGFKVFKLDSSNIKSWDGNPENLNESLFDAVGNIKTDRTEEDVLYEILLKYGLDLTLPIEERIIEGKKVFNVGLGSLFICLSDNITAKVAEGIGQWKEACSPEICRVIFKDNGFTDVEKTNSVQTLKRYGINEIKSI